MSPAYPEPPSDRLEELLRLNDRRPAHELGLTMLQASAVYGVPLSEVRRRYIWGTVEPATPPLGSIDHYGCWYGDPTEVRRALGHSTPSLSPTLTAAQSRAATKADALRARLAGGFIR